MAAAIALAPVGPVEAQPQDDGQPLRIAASGDYPPFNSVGPNGELQGFDIDIARALCTSMARQCSFVQEPWETLIEGLLGGRSDAIVSSLPITEARQKLVAFTEPYYRNPLVFVAGKNPAPAGNSPAALAGKRLGAQTGTAAMALLRDSYPDAKLTDYPTLQAALAAVAAGEVDAVLADAGPVSLWLRTNAGDCCAYLGDPVGASDAMGIAVLPGDTALRDAFDEALAAIIADGTFGRIAADYFPFPLR